MTVSGDGQLIAYDTLACPRSAPQPFYVAVTDLRTGQTKRWTTPAAGSPSLTASGSMLYYTMNLQPGTSVVRGMPTSAAPGSAADRSRTVVQADAFGPTDQVPFATILSRRQHPVLRHVPRGALGPGLGQVRALNLATGRSRVVYAPAAAGARHRRPGRAELLLQIPQPRDGPAQLLARLNLATGRVTDLPSGWLGPVGSVLTW